MEDTTVIDYLCSAEVQILGDVHKIRNNNNKAEAFEDLEKVARKIKSTGKTLKIRNKMAQDEMKKLREENQCLKRKLETEEEQKSKVLCQMGIMEQNMFAKEEECNKLAQKLRTAEVTVTHMSQDLFDYSDDDDFENDTKAQEKINVDESINVNEPRCKQKMKISE